MLPVDAMPSEKVIGELRRRVLLISDRPLGRHGMAQLINRQPDLIVAADVDEIGPGLDVLKRETVDLAVLDLSETGMAGTETVKTLHDASPEMAILVVGPRTDPAFAVRAIRAGAKGFITNREDVKEFVAAVRQVAAGQAYLSPAFSEQLVHDISQGGVAQIIPDLGRLSGREREVLQLLGAGNTSRQIAEKLGLSAKTVDAHRAHIKEKLGLRNAAELLRFAADSAALD